MDNPQETLHYLWCRGSSETIRRVSECGSDQNITMSNKNSLEPWWLTGFVDGEGTFYVGINENKEMSAGYQVLPEFRIVQHYRDIKLLYKIKSFLGCGVVRKGHNDRYELRVRKIEHLTNIVIPFFEEYPLQTQKQFDFFAWCKVVLLISQDQHLTQEGIKKIFHTVKKMNKGDKDKTKNKLNEQGLLN